MIFLWIAIGAMFLKKTKNALIGEKMRKTRNGK